MNDLLANQDFKPSADQQLSETVTALLAREAVTPYRAPESTRGALKVTYYHHDSSVFFDSKYVTRAVPGRILWKLLTEIVQSNRYAFTNRELRHDPGLRLPEVRDNLETRLLLLRRVLEAKFPHVRICRTGRGHFRVELDKRLELQVGT